jgi:5-methylcytosine-specific restriction protein A
MTFRQSARKVYGRSRGRCEICVQHEATQFHHRRPRGQGGSKDPEVHSPANLLHLCYECHQSVEANSGTSYPNGWKIKHGILDPELVPALRRGRWVLLDDLATVEYLEDRT